MFNSAIFSIHWVDGYTRVHLAGSSREKVQNHKELMGQVGESPGNTADCVFNCFDCGVHVGFNGNAEHGRRYQSGRSVGVLQRSRTNWQISKWNFFSSFGSHTDTRTFTSASPHSSQHTCTPADWLVRQADPANQQESPDPKTPGWRHNHFDEVSHQISENNNFCISGSEVSLPSMQL